MSPALALVRRLSFADSGARRYWGLGALISLHLAALIVLFRTEEGVAAGLIFLLAWGLLNFALLAVLRRPVVRLGCSNPPPRLKA